MAVLFHLWKDTVHMCPMFWHLTHPLREDFWCLGAFGRPDSNALTVVPLSLSLSQIKIFLHLSHFLTLSLKSKVKIAVYLALREQFEPEIDFTSFLSLSKSLSGNYY